MNQAFAMKRTSLVIALVVGLLLPLGAQQIIQIGAGTLVTDQYEASPINIYYRSLHGQVIYTKAELNAAGFVGGNILSLGFHVESPPTYNLPNYTVKMKHTTLEDTDTYDAGAFTTVLTIPSYAPAPGGFDLLELDEPFIWNGVENIMLDVCFDQVTDYTATGTVRYYTAPSFGFNYTIDDSESQCPLQTYDYTGNKPQIQMGISGTSPNDAGIASFLAPIDFCPGVQPITVRVANFGNNIIDSLDVMWTFDGVQQPTYHYTTPLDTLGGAGSPTVDVTVGSKNFAVGQLYDFSVWTANPNGQQDTINNNDSLQMGLQASLQGTYTVGGTSPDYATLGDAAASLANYGVCGPVFLNIRDGIYNEQFSLGVIDGVSAVNTITFQSESGDSTAVSINSSSSFQENYTVKLSAASHIIFNQITLKSLNTSYGTVVRFENAANNNLFTNCVLEAPAITTTSSSMAVVYADQQTGNYHNNFTQNRIVNGSSGLYLYGQDPFGGGGVELLAATNFNGTANSTVTIADNEFVNQYYNAIHLVYHTAPIVRNNRITTSSTYTSFIGTHVENCTEGICIEKNKYEITNGGYGIRSYYNQVAESDSAYIANNFISIAGVNTATGIYIYFTESMGVYFNNINITSTYNNTLATGLYAYGGINNDYYNNNFINTGASYAAYITNFTGIDFDYNNIYTTSIPYVFLENSYNDLASVQAAGYNANGFSLLPGYTSATDLHVTEIALNKTGIPIPFITEDIDGEARNPALPDIGADEFLSQALDIGVTAIASPATPFPSGNSDIMATLRNLGEDTISSATINWVLNGQTGTPANWTGTLATGATTDVVLSNQNFEIDSLYDITAWSSLPNGSPDLDMSNDTASVTDLTPSLNGVYTIGGTNPDYPSFTSAVADLIVKGASGSVTFNVRDGNYSENISITDFPGAGCGAEVVFQSESGDSTAVTLSNNNANASANYVLQLDGADGLTFRNLSFNSSGSYATVIDIRNGADCNKFFNNEINGVFVNSTSFNYSLVYSPSDITNIGNEFHSNKFNNGSLGFNIQGNSSFPDPANLVIADNQFENQYYRSISLTYMEHSMITDNSFLLNTNYTSCSSIYTSSCDEGTAILGNKINQVTGVGIYFYYSDGISTNRNLIANNFISIAGTSSSTRGLYVYNSDYLDIYNNNINITTINANATAFYTYSAAVNNSKNNNFVNNGDGYAAYFSSGIPTSDYNNYFTNGPQLIYYNGQYATLAAWQDATPQDDNSKNVDPVYTSNSDLHVSIIDLNGAGTPLAEVPTDIDGETRDPSTPDIGADEFFPPANDAGIAALALPGIPFATGSQAVSILLKNYGGDSLKTVSLQWEFDGNAQTPFNWTGALASGDTISVNLGSQNFLAGTPYAIKAWTELPNAAADLYNDNDTLLVNDIYAALSGTYTLGGSSPDFLDFDAALFALETRGVLDSVIFEVRDGTYGNQLNIPAILGVGCENRVTFQSESGIASNVILSYNSSSTNNYTIQLDGATGFTFKNMTIEANNSSYARVISLNNGASCNHFIGNRIISINTSSTTTNRAAISSQSPTVLPNLDNHFIGNTIQDGSYGIYHQGNSSAIAANYLVQGNKFIGQYYMAVNANSVNAWTIDNNEITTDNTLYSSYYGILLNGTSTIISNNKLNVNGRFGIYLSGAQGTPAALVANNFISLDYSGTSAAYALYIDNVSNANVFYNSVSLNSTNVDSRAAYFYYCSNTGVFNNVFSNRGEGSAIDLYFGTPMADYNDYYTVNGPIGRYNGALQQDLAAWQSVYAQDQNTISVPPGFVSDNDLHTNQILLDGAGLPQTLVTTDIDGQDRDINMPDIGADEFFPLNLDAAVLSVDAPVSPILAGSREVIVSLYNNGTTTLDSLLLDWTVNGISQPAVTWTDTLEAGETKTVTLGDFTFSGVAPFEIQAWSSAPNGQGDLFPANDTATASNLYVGLSGDYYIGGLNADFNNFTEAAAALANNGLAGPVNFIVRSGIYNESIEIAEINGNTPDNPITFRSEVADSSAVTLNDNTTNTLYLNGVDHVSFYDMGFATTYFHAVNVYNNSRNISFDNCLFQGRLVSSTSSSYATFYSSGFADDSLAIRNSVIRDGSYGIYSRGASTSNLEQGLTIEGNLLADQYYTGIYVEYANAPVIRNNTISSFSAYSSTRGMLLSYCDNEMEVSGNTINVSPAVYGIYLNYCDGGIVARGKTYNNFIQVGGANTPYGIYTYYSNNQDLHFNSVNISNTAATSYGLYMIYGSAIDIRNNVLANTGGGYSIYSNVSNNVAGSDYNDLYTTGMTLGYWNGDQTDLAAWRTASGFDANSFSVDPMFVTTEDLHVTQANLDGTGNPITGITTDIDGQLRNETTPDIGADEFGAGLAVNDAGITAILSPESACELDSLLTVSLRIQNFGTDTLTAFEVVYVVNDTLTVTENVGSLSIPGGTNASYDFVTPLAVEGFNIYTLYAYTQLIDDSNVENDTVGVRLIQRYPLVQPSVTEDKTACQGSYASFQASGGTSYQWRTIPFNSIISYGSYVNVAPNDTTSYEVTVFNAEGCSATDTATVNILPRPTTPNVTIFGSFSGCDGDTVVLESNITQNIEWNTGETTATIEVYQPGYYTVTHTDTLSGCQSGSTVYLGGTSPPYVNGPNFICEGNSATLSVINGSAYLWDTGDVTQSINVSPTATTVYSVTVTTSAGCVYQRSRSVVVYPNLPAPVITDITPDTSVCQGEYILLQVAGSAVSYTWSNGRTGSTNYVNPSSTTTYTVTASNGACSAGTDSETVTVSVLPVPDPPIIVATGSSSLTFCDADSILLTSSNFPDSIVWNTGATAQSIWAYTPGTYTVYHIGANGCAASESVTLIDPPKPYISGNTTICEGETATLVVQNGLSYDWSTGNNTQSISVSPVSSTRYYVDITNEAGCMYQDSIDVTVIPVPVINSITADTAVCVGEPVTLSVNGTAINFIWSNGLAGPSITVNPTETTTYTVNATNGAGCTALANSSVTVSTLPLPNQPTIIPSDTVVICAGTSVDLTSSIATDIYWNGAGNNATITVSAPGDYIVTHFNSFGCELSDTTTVLFPVEPTIAITDDQMDICEGSSSTLTAAGGVSYAWSTGESTAAITISPTDTTTYSVTITNAENCTYTKTQDINVVPLGLPIGAPSNMLPPDGELNVFPPVSLSWSPSDYATNYDLYVWPAAATRPVSPSITALTQISTVYSGLTSGTEYSWQVVARNFCDSTLGAIQNFTLRDYPDLVTTEVQIPAAAFSGQPMSIDWVVKNSGDGFTTGQWYDAVYLSNDTLLDPTFDPLLGNTANFSALNPGTSYASNTTVNLPNGIEGAYYVFVVTDVYGAEVELDNTNNTGISMDSVLITLTPPPDLQVTQIITPNNVFSGQNFNINYTVSNLGDGQSVNGTWVDRFYFSDTTEYNPGASTYLGQLTYAGTLKEDSVYTRSFTGTIPSGIFGEYYVHVVTDYFNDEYEHANELNNNAVGNPINVTLTPPPDLQVTSIVIPDTAAILGNISLTWTVENLGGTAADPYWYDRVYLSQEAVQPDLNQAKYLGQVLHNTALYPTENYTTTKNFNVPDNIVGPYYVYVFTDGTDRVFEFLNNNNNLSRSDSSLRVVTPDLEVSEVTGPAAANSGETISLSWEVGNIGAAAALNQNRSDKIMLSPGSTFNELIAVELALVSRTTNLNSNDSITETVTVALPNGIGGQYYLYVKADAGNLIYEPNLEANNVNINGTPITVNLSPWVDLTPEDLLVQDSAVAGQIIPFDYQTSNRGTAIQANGTWVDHVYISLVDTFDIGTASLLAISTRNDSLPVDSSYWASLNLSLPANLVSDHYYIYVRTDDADDIYEYNFEGNNILRSDSIYIESYPPVDLAVLTATAPNMGNSGQAFDVSYSVKNQAAVPTIVPLWYDGVFLSTDTIWNYGIDLFIDEYEVTGPIDSNAVYSNTLNTTLPNGTQGNYYVIVVSDYKGNNSDSDLGNNYRIVRDGNGDPQVTTVTLTPPPDLRIASANIPTQGIAGQPLAISYTVNNNGTGPTLAGSWTDKIYLSTDFDIDGSDQIIATVPHTGNLGVGGSYTKNVSASLPVNQAGNRIIIIKTDNNDAVYEHLNEGNNVTTGPITVIQPPPSDLVVTEIMAPAMAVAGTTITIDWKVKNEGDNPATGSMKEAVYLSTDMTWDIDDALLAVIDANLNLAPQAETTHSLSTPLTGVPIGDYHAIVRTDILNNIFESSDSNNTTAAIQITQVDVRELPLETLTADSLFNEIELYYRIEIADTLVDETMLTTLKADSINGINELYLRYGDIPTRVEYDYVYEEPFSGNQEVIIPELLEGTYYLLAYGSSLVTNRQDITLLAEILDFEIRNVNANEGGNTGSVTVEINGSKFEETMILRLENGGTPIVASNIYFVNPTRVYATFDLSAAALGTYDVVADKNGELATLVNGFTVVTGQAPSLTTNIILPAATRPGRTVPIQIEFQNDGNVDLVNPTSILKSLAGAPIGFTPADLLTPAVQLDILMLELNGPPTVLRPGAGGIITIYARADSALAFLLELPDFD